jgi:DNA helicase-2/ATP-dependent DNA helicase PcrA
MTAGRDLPERSSGGRRRVDYAAELNPEQLAAVLHPTGPMLVLAGAGSGKTRTLVYRVCRLIEDGVPPGRLLLLTFTNKAAREMLERVGALLGDLPGRVSGGTFHSAGHRILRRYAETLGYSPRFTIVDREDATELMASALAAVSPDKPERRLPRAKLLIELYSHVINTGRALEGLLAERAPQFLDQQPRIAETFRAYLERKRRADAMDFDDLLLNWLMLLRRQPEARAELDARFDHILVDEYQDTNRLQSDIVEAMLGPERNLCVVGDDAQAIYGFRGADFENILRFPERHPDCTLFRLETSYRSTPQILALANASIAHNQQGFPKALRAVRPDGELPRDVTVPTPEAQATWVADEILRLREEGLGLDEMVALYRNHSHSLELQVELTRRNIPFRVRSGLRFFEQRHIKDVLAHLRFVDNPRDEVSFSRLIKLRRGFGPKLALRLWQAIDGGDPLTELLQGRRSAVSLSAGAQRSLTEVRTLLEPLCQPALRDQAGESVRHVVDHFYRAWAKDALDGAGSRLEDLEQLAVFADGYPDVNTFLAEITLLNELSGEESIGGPDDETLTLSTTHQAKGLEWRAVFMIWVSEGRFPSPRCEDEEEERRLFYVALTRAKDDLALVHPALARDRYRVDVVLDPSRFLLELPTDRLESVSVRPALEGPTATALPEARYELPAFLESGNGTDGDVN